MPERSPTLRSVEEYAEQIYGEYKKQAKAATYYKEKYLWCANNGYPEEAFELMGAEYRCEQLATAAIKAAATHYNDNQSAYFELAVMDAHIDGVNINRKETSLDNGQMVLANT